MAKSYLKTTCHATQFHTIWHKIHCINHTRIAMLDEIVKVNGMNELGPLLYQA